MNSVWSWYRKMYVIQIPDNCRHSIFRPVIQTSITFDQRAISTFEAMSIQNRMQFAPGIGKRTLCWYLKEYNYRGRGTETHTLTRNWMVHGWIVDTKRRLHLVIIIHNSLQHTWFNASFSSLFSSLKLLMFAASIVVELVAGFVPLIVEMFSPSGCRYTDIIYWLWYNNNWKYDQVYFCIIRMWGYWSVRQELFESCEIYNHFTSVLILSPAP